MSTQAAGVQAPALAITIDSVAIGVARDFTRPGSRSAIDKRAVDGRVHVGPDGLHGDEQGDRRVHGGPDKRSITIPVSTTPPGKPSSVRMRCWRRPAHSARI
ncbi:hypothetical protein GGR69_001957 [Xanthomonas arboricola]|nr:hypothetical protein [Xanthomonas arboricola]